MARRLARRFSLEVLLAAPALRSFVKLSKFSAPCSPSTFLARITMLRVVSPPSPRLPRLLHASPPSTTLPTLTAPRNTLSSLANLASTPNLTKRSPKNPRSALRLTMSQLVTLAVNPPRSVVRTGVVPLLSAPPRPSTLLTKSSGTSSPFTKNSATISTTAT